MLEKLDSLHFYKERRLLKYRPLERDEYPRLKRPTEIIAKAQTLMQPDGSIRMYSMFPTSSEDWYESEVIEPGDLKSISDEDYFTVMGTLSVEIANIMNKMRQDEYIKELITSYSPLDNLYSNTEEGKFLEDYSNLARHLAYLRNEPNFIQYVADHVMYTREPKPIMGPPSKTIEIRIPELHDPEQYPISKLRTMIHGS